MFCSRPFEQFYVTEDGDVHLCCPEWIAMPAGNLFARSPMEIWTGKVAKNIRDSMLDGSFRHCIHCPFLPNQPDCGVVNPLKVDALEWNDWIDTLNLSYDKTCNLSCPSCRHKIQGRGANADRIQEILIKSGIFNHAHNINASGSGDPIASHLFWQLLDHLSLLKRHPRLTLQTNGVLLNERMWKKLGNHAQYISHILVSIDAATPDTYRENRGADFQTVVSNLPEITKRKIRLQISFVVQANNYREMPAFVELGHSCGAHRVYFSGVQNWGTYRADDFVKREVHSASHPLYNDLLKTLIETRKLAASKPIEVVFARLPTP
jgi:MoaA/NifB/PqqE/SkfB family radical SAM enzyme